MPCGFSIIFPSSRTKTLSNNSLGEGKVGLEAWQKVHWPVAGSKPGSRSKGYLTSMRASETLYLARKSPTEHERLFFGPA
jgi:hypothetical protein